MNEEFIVQRKTLTANTPTTFEFGVVGYEFCVKNLTTGSILVSCGTAFDENKSITIPSKYAHNIYSEERYGSETGINKLFVKSEEAGTVEIYCKYYRK